MPRLRALLRSRILWRMARAKRPKIKVAVPTALVVARQFEAVRHLLRPQPGQVHGNTRLYDCDVFTALLCGFFDPLVRSQRTIEQLSEVPAVQEQLEVDRIPRSTLSDALSRFNTEPLFHVLQLLKRQLPPLKYADANLEQLVGKLVAADASYFNMAGDVAWALRQKNADGTVLSRVRLDFQLDVRRWTPEMFAVHGSEMGNESRSQELMLQKDVIYLVDRLYAHHRFIKKIFAAGAHVVVRAKKDLVRQLQEERSLGAKDREAGVQFDEIVKLGTGKPKTDAHKEDPPQQALRLVSVWDAVNQQQVLLLTDLFDVEAWVIAYMYRCRWIIELFFRWLKVTAAMEHLVSHNATGITVQFYVAVIAVMLMHLQTGLPVSKYALVGLSFVARGQATVAEVMPGILRREREKMLEKQRLARKKALQQTLAQLPG